MPFGRTQGWKALQNDTPNYVILIEPPDADPHVRWCERGRLITAPYSIDPVQGCQFYGVLVGVKVAVAVAGPVPAVAVAAGVLVELPTMIATNTSTPNNVPLAVDMRQ